MDMLYRISYNPNCGIVSEETSCGQMAARNGVIVRWSFAVRHTEPLGGLGECGCPNSCRSDLHVSGLHLNSGACNQLKRRLEGAASLLQALA